MMDPLSGVSIPLLTFILTHGLEVKHFLSNASRVMTSEIAMSNILYDQGDVKTVLTGSAPEGLSLEHLSDIDIMTVMKIPIYTSCKKNTPFMASLRTSDACRRTQCDSADLVSCVDSDHAYLNVEDSEWQGYQYLHKCNNKGHSNSFSDIHVNGTMCIEAHLTDIDKYWELKNIAVDTDEDPIETMQITQYRPQKRFSRHGPSGATYAMFGEDVMADTDNVVSLEYPSNAYEQKYVGWPNCANEWVERQRPSGWPSADVIKEVIVSPVYLVPKGHPLSKYKDFEWRISFSYAEVILSRSFNQAQRYCLLIYKLIYYSLLKPLFKEEISTYHFKTTMYWLSEKYPPSRWDMENLGELFLLLTDEYISFLEKRNLPMYFVRDNNLVIHLNDELIEKVLNTMLEIRNNPLKYTMLHLRLPGYRQLPSDTFIQLYKANIENNIEGIQENTTLMHEVFASMLTTLGEHELGQGNYDVSIGLLEDALREYELTYGQSQIQTEGIMAHLLVASHLEGRLDDALMYAAHIRSYLLSEPPDQRETGDWQQHYVDVSLRLARLHSVMSDGNEGQQSDGHIEQAEGLYQNLLEASPSDMAVNTEYAHFLLIKGRVKEAVRYLEIALKPLLNLPRDIDTACTVHGGHESPNEAKISQRCAKCVDGQPMTKLFEKKTMYTTADKPVVKADLHYLISSSTKNMQTPTVILAYYLLIESYNNLKLTEKVKELFGIHDDLMNSLFKSAGFEITGLSILDIVKEKVTGEKIPDDLKFMDSGDDSYPYSFRTVCQHLLAWAKDMRQSLHQIHFDNVFETLNVKSLK